MKRWIPTAVIILFLVNIFSNATINGFEKLFNSNSAPQWSYDIDGDGTVEFEEDHHQDHHRSAFKIENLEQKFLSDNLTYEHSVLSAVIKKTFLPPQKLTSNFIKKIFHPPKILDC